MEEKAKYTIKDSVFTHLFSEKKYALQMYQALHPEDKDVSQDDIQVITIENILINGIYNDLGLKIKDKMILLAEAQSTWSVNILVRSFLYLAETYNQYFADNTVKLYGTQKVALPVPELYVLYTGDRQERPKTLSLSESFFEGKKTSLEIQIHMLYDETEDIIGQYIAFTKVYDAQRMEHPAGISAGAGKGGSKHYVLSV